MTCRHRLPVLISTGLAMALISAGCTGGGAGPQPGGPKPGGPRADKPAGCVPIVKEGGTKTDKCLPVAPRDKRVDTGKPKFSHPLKITNRLHPTARTTQTILGGTVDDKPFRTEVTTLDDVKTIKWQGRTIKAVTSQYLAFSGGRIVEVALDWYAQADNGAVWYLGEDVYNYQAGRVKNTEGSWEAGVQGPGGMIMPGHPDMGDVYRPENHPGTVFEEVTVAATDETVKGPSGPVEGAIVVDELHQEGGHEKKTFAPGYGEFSTGTPSGELEAVSMALPIDAAGEPAPPELATIGNAAKKAANAVADRDWGAASDASTTLTKTWNQLPRGDAPLTLLRKQTERDITSLDSAVADRNASAARDSALRVAQDQLDLQSRHQRVADTELARMRLWARQVVLDADARDLAAVLGDVATLKWTFDRVRDTVANPGAVDRDLTTIRKAAQAKHFTAATSAADQLLTRLE